MNGQICHINSMFSPLLGKIHSKNIYLEGFPCHNKMRFLPMHRKAKLTFDLDGSVITDSSTWLCVKILRFATCDDCDAHQTFDSKVHHKVFQHSFPQQIMAV